MQLRNRKFRLNDFEKKDQNCSKKNAKILKRKYIQKRIQLVKLQYVFNS